MRPSLFLSLLLGLNSLSLPGWSQQQPGEAPPNPAPETAPAPPIEGADAAAGGVLAPANRATAPDAAPKRDGRREGSETRLRAMMSDLGLEDSTKQDAVVGYLKEDEAGKNVVRGALRRLSFAMTHGADNGRLRDLIAVYKAALDADKERRSAAQNALNAKIGFTLDARVEAVLWLFGVLGDGASGPPQNLMQRSSQGRGASQNGNGNKTRGNNGDGKARRPEIVRGIVENKGEGWLEMRDERGKLERFSFIAAPEAARAMPLETAPETTTQTTIEKPAEKNLAVEAGQGFDRALLDSIRVVAIGAPTRLTWVWNDRKQIVKIEPWTPEKTPDAKTFKATPPDAQVPTAAPEPEAAAPDAAPK